MTCAQYGSQLTFFLCIQPDRYGQTRHSFLAILKRFPHDLTVLEELRAVLIELADFSTCSDLYQKAFEHFQVMYPTGRGPEPPFLAGGGFDLMRILTLVDLHNVTGDYVKAILAIKQGCRWLQGRGLQTYWDQCSDDREYDIAELYTRTLEDGDIAPGCFAFDVNARQRLAISRIKIGDIDEGKVGIHRLIIHWRILLNGISKI